MSRRVKFCRDYDQNRYCRFGEGCYYLHVPSEFCSSMSTANEYANDETNQKDLKISDVCPYFNSDFGCGYTHSCRFLHVRPSVTFAIRCLKSYSYYDYIVSWKKEKETLLRSGFKNLQTEKVIIFDFDKTLMDSFEKGRAIKYFNSVSKTKWADLYGKAFYSRPESLMSPFKINKGPSFEDYVHAEKERKKNRWKIVSMLVTGRDSKFDKVVMTILEKYGLYFDYLVFKPPQWKINTEWYKIGLLNSFVKEKFPNVKIVEMYEDRFEHFNSFIVHGKKRNVGYKLIMKFASQFRSNLLRCFYDNNRTDLTVCTVK